MSKYLLILHEPLDTSDAGREEIKHRLASYIGLPVQAVNAMFLDFPVIFQQGLSLEEAQLQKKELEVLGANVEILAQELKSSENSKISDLSQTLEQQPQENSLNNSELELQFDFDLTPKDITASNKSPGNSTQSRNPLPDSSPALDFQQPHALPAQAANVEIPENLNLKFDTPPNLPQQELSIEQSPSTGKTGTVVKDTAVKSKPPETTNLKMEGPKAADSNIPSPTASAETASQQQSSPDTKQSQSAETPSPEEAERILRRAFSAPESQPPERPAHHFDSQQTHRNIRNLADPSNRFGARKLSSIGVGAIVLSLVALIAFRNPMSFFHENTSNSITIHSQKEFTELLKQHEAILGVGKNGNNTSKNEKKDGSEFLLTWSGQTTDQNFTVTPQILTDASKVTLATIEVTSVPPPKLSIEDVSRGVKPKAWLRKLTSEKLTAISQPIDEKSPPIPANFHLEGTGKAYIEESTTSHRVIVKVVLIGIWDAAQKKIHGTWTATAGSQQNIQNTQNLIEGTPNTGMRIAIGGQFDATPQEAKQPAIPEPQKTLETPPVDEAQESQDNQESQETQESKKADDLLDEGIK